MIGKLLHKAEMQTVRVYRTSVSFDNIVEFRMSWWNVERDWSDIRNKYSSKSEYVNTFSALLSFKFRFIYRVIIEEFNYLFIDQRSTR